MLEKFGNVPAATSGRDKTTDVLERCGFADMLSSLPLPTSFNLRRFRAYHLQLEAVDPMNNGTASSEVMWILPLPIR